MSGNVILRRNPMPSIPTSAPTMMVMPARHWESTALLASRYGWPQRSLVLPLMLSSSEAQDFASALERSLPDVPGGRAGPGPRNLFESHSGEMRESLGGVIELARAGSFIVEPGGV